MKLNNTKTIEMHDLCHNLLFTACLNGPLHQFLEKDANKQ